jgi:hypothetical protein
LLSFLMSGTQEVSMQSFFHRLAASIAILVVAATTATGRIASAQESYEGWHLEPGVGQAHLVMVVRVASVSQLTIIQGAKTDVALREYRFQPIRRLKGLFQRDQLSMTGADLGCPPEAAGQPCPLKEGEFRLLILAQQQGRWIGCVSAAPGASTFEERVPLLTGPDDPLVGAIETLIQVADSQSRRERASLAIKRLKDVDGRAAVPLLSSLRLRGDWAATDDDALPVLNRLTQSQSTAVRGAALETLREALEGRIAPEEPRRLDEAANALRKVLESDEPVTRLRLSALEGLGHLLAVKADVAWARDLLISQSTVAKTHAERTAAVVALSRIAHQQSKDAVFGALTQLPLDETSARESVYAQAAVRLDREGAERILLARLEQSMEARQSLDAEIQSLGRMNSQKSLPLLLTAATLPHLESADRLRVAWALGRLRDDEAVPILTSWLRSDQYQLKEAALTALETIDSKQGARDARPLLKTEGHLPYKLRIARLLARHELADGYALATEHLADVAHTASATLVLAALRDARTSKDLSAIVAARPDRRWHAAALAGLAATGDAAVRRQLLAIMSDERNPLAADAAEAAGLAGDADLLLPLARLVQSRNKQIAMASLVALRRHFSGVRTSPLGLDAVDRPVEKQIPRDADAPANAHPAIAAAVASLLLDAYVDSDLRLHAFAVARLLLGDRYDELLTALADQAELEGSQLLTLVETERRRRRGVND